MAKIKSEVGLSDQQMQIVNAANNAFEKAFSDAHDVYHGNTDLAKEYWNKFDAQRKAAIEKSLTPEQVTKFLDIVKDQFDEWLIAPLDMPRGMKTEDLQAALNQAGIEAVVSFPNITEAYQSALSQATENDRIVTFGSFHTVAEVMDIPRY